MVKQILVTVLSGILVWLITWGILSDKILNGKNDFSEQPINQNENHKQENSYELEKVRNAREEAEAKARKAEEAAHKLEIEKERIAREEAEARARKAEEAAHKLEIEKENQHKQIEEQITNISRSVNNEESSKKLNKMGERAYHAGNYDEAIRLYQAAIELNEINGQAYSNLGLAYQKAGRLNEAFWANRKAIEVATGASAAIIRASSYYNNGKIYEEMGQYNDALREYQYAKHEKYNPIYDKAILRMQQQGAR